MKKWMAELLTLTLLLSFTGCQQEMTINDLEDYADEFSVSNHADANGIVSIRIPANLPVEHFQISVAGFPENGEAVDLMKSKEVEPGKTLAFQDLEAFTSMEIVIEEVLEGTVYPSAQWNLDLKTGTMKSARHVNRIG